VKTVVPQLFIVSLVLGCAADNAGPSPFPDGEHGDTEAGDDGDDGDDDEGDADAGSDGSDEGMEPPLLDVSGESGGDGDADQCKVVDDMDGVAPCLDKAPPDSFEPVLEWAWEGEAGARESVVTPLVANLTDDDDNGEIDLCDVPDVVVTAYESDGVVPWQGTLYVLDGESGAAHFSIDQAVSNRVNPALGDIDGDGLPEIVTAIAEPMHTGRLVAFEHDGTLAWVGDTEFSILQGAVTLADLDADGDVEIMLRGHVADHLGRKLWSASSSVGWIHIPTAADLDGDDDLEIIHGATAYHHDGSVYYDHDSVFPVATPQVADLDADGQPEVIVVGQAGIALIEHDGTLTEFDRLPELTNYQPAAIHDVDGDGEPEVAIGDTDVYSIVEANLGLKWTADIIDASGYAAGTAFDFLGDGQAEAMYADETTLWAFDQDGAPVFMAERASWTQAENPVVADVDNDASAEVVLVSNAGYVQADAPPVQVVRDQQDRWVPARRIWNQHAYHVTNVREDGTIPTVQPKHWQELNTFRTQAQIAVGGGVCQPEG
jgi:hypothetical protein